MVRKIGKILVIIITLLNVSLLCATPITMRFVQDGQVIKKARVGVPFTIEITVPDEVAVKSVHVAGINDEEVLHRSTRKHIQSVNGVRSAKTIFQMLVRFDKGEIRTIGPVTLEHEGGVLHATACALEISDKQIKRKFLKELVLSIDKNSAVIGEKIAFSIKLYTPHLLDIKGLVPPDLESSFEVDQMKDPIRGVESHNGKQCQYIEWKTTIIPKVAGALLIPAAVLVYEPIVGARNKHAFRNGFTSIFSASREKKLYSNTLQVFVDAVPAHERSLVVGNFDAIEASVNQHEAMQGEGIVYSLTLYGDADFKRMKHPSLELPSSIAVYESSKNNDFSDGSPYVVFEYILQARESGEIILPAHVLHYFDTSSRTAQSLTTQPIKITIHDSENAVVPDVIQRKGETDNKSNTDVIEEGLYLSECEPWYPITQARIPWNMFFLLCMLMTGVYSLARLRLLLLPFMIHWGTVRRRKNAFQKARKKLFSLKKIRDIEGLLLVMHTLYADLTDKDIQYISKNDIMQLFSQAQIPNDVVQKWGQYYHILEEIVYYSNVRYTEKDRLRIINESIIWLEQLRSYFKL